MHSRLERLHNALCGYIPAVLAVSVAMGLHGVLFFLLQGKVPGNLAFFLYLLAFLIGAWCGYGPGLVTTAIITCGMPYFFKPGFSVRTVDVGGVTIFLLLSLIVSGAAASRRRTEALLRKLNDELDARVSEQTHALQHQLAELETLYEQLSVGLGFLDSDLRFLRVNQKLALFSGMPVEAFQGRRLQEVVAGPMAEVLTTVCNEVLGSQGSFVQVESAGSFTGKDSGQFWAVSCSGVALNSKLLGLQVVVQDITERKQFDAKLRQAYEDLEQFAYSASHDLQEPVRSVGIYSQLLKRQFGGVLGPKGEECLQFTLAGAKRMQELVQGLLAYTDVSLPDGEPLEVVSSTSCLEIALSNLRASLEESRASVEYGELPPVAIRQSHLVQILQNLVSNSIRYRGPEDLRVHIAATAANGGRWQFSVKDNGIGIAPSYQERVFGIFKKLHRTEQYPGSGMGLAICKRILSQYDCKIWVESKAGDGATFHFTLPEAKTAPTLRYQAHTQ